MRRLAPPLRRLPAVALFAGAFAVFGIGDRFIYQPRPLAKDFTAARLGIEGAEDCELRASDGVRLTAVYLPRKDARATVLYLHGNGGNLAGPARWLARFGERARVDVLVLDYRGYGRSEGMPSEEGLYRDAEAAYDHLVEKHGAAPRSLLVYGHSLGTAVAVELALRRPVAGVILEAPFTSIPAVVESAVPFLDARRVLSERFDNLEKAPRLTAPVVVVHGTKDRTIPHAHGKAVAEAVRAPSVFISVSGAGHGDSPRVAGERFAAEVDRLIEGALARAARPARLF